MQPGQQQAAAAVPQPNPQQAPQLDMPNMVDPIGVPLQPNIIDPYRRSGTTSRSPMDPSARFHDSVLGADNNADIYCNNMPTNNYAMPSHPSNLVNGHHHDMQMNNFGQPAITNGYGMNLKQEPDGNF